MPVFRIDDPIPLQEADGLWRDLRPNYEAIDIPANLRFFTIPGKEEHGPQPYIMWSNGRKMRVRCEVIVLDQQGRMLIKPNPSFKRLGDTYQYDLPGGGIDKGETVEEAATRECKEEALLIPENVKFTGIHYTYEVPNKSKEEWANWGHVSFVCVGMKGDPYTGYVAPMDREKSFVKRMQWVYPHEIDTIPAHEEAIRWYKQYYWKPMQEAAIPTDEYHINRFISGQDVYVNYDKWTSGKANKLFIIGLSGSGKSTLGNALAAQFHCDVVHTDRFRGNVHYSEEELFKIDPVVYRYFDTVWKGGLKHRFDVKTMPKDERTREFERFIHWVLDQDDRIIIEGAVEKLLIKDPKLQDYPIVFKGTSMAKSMFRMVRRELIEKPTFEGAPLSWILKFITRYSDMRDLNNQARDSVMQHGPSYRKLDESAGYGEAAEFKPMSGSATAPKPGQVYDPQVGMWLDPAKKDKDRYIGWFMAEEKEWLKKVTFISDPNVRGGKPQPVIYMNGKTYRPRCEVIVLDGYKVLIDPVKNRGNFKPNPYSLPGGGVDSKGEGIAAGARRECEEEARIIPKNCIYTGIAWVLEFADPTFNDGSISFICIAERGKDYKGYVKVEDRDPFVDRAKWVDYRKFKLGEPHQKAIDIFRKMQLKEEGIADLDTSFLEASYAQTTDPEYELVIEGLNYLLNGFKYGIIVNGQVKTNDDIDFTQYTTIHPDVFERLHVGTCWDYVAYEYNWIKSHNSEVKFVMEPLNLNKPQFSCYYMQHEDDDGDKPTHTWLAYTSGGKVYAFESAWKPIAGIHEFDSELSMVRWYIQQQEEYQRKAGNRTHGAIVIKFTPPERYGLNPVAYMDYVKKTGLVVYSDFPQVWKVDILLREGCETSIDEATGAVRQPIAISDDDIYVNFDKFKSGKAKTCLITGLSGSGKSTLAKKLAEGLGAYYVTTDVISFGISSLHPERANWDYIKENDKYLYRYFKEKGLQPDCLQKYDWHGEEKNEIVTPYIKWLCLERDDDGLVVCEGGDVAIALRDTPELAEMPIVFKGTSIAKSMFRRFLRMSGKHDVWFAIKNVIDKFGYQYGKMIPEVNAARKTILSKSEYEYQHEAGPM